MKQTSGIVTGLRIGAMDRKIYIEQKEYEVTGSGARTEVWDTWAIAWASVEESKSQSDEKEERKKNTAVSSTAFTIRYRAGVTTLLRVRYKELLFDIKSIAEIGRRGYLVLNCEARL